MTVLNPVDIDQYMTPGPLDPESAAMWAELLADHRRDHTEIIVYDRAYNPLGELREADIISDENDERWNKIGEGEIQLKGSNEFVPLFESINNTVVPITILYNGVRKSYRVAKYHNNGIKGNEVVTLSLIDEYAWFSAILAFPQPLLPPEIQFPPQDIMIAPLKTLIAWYTIRNAWRLGLPITFMPYNIFTDTTPLMVGMARMVSLSNLFEQWLKDTGCRLTITLWLPGDPQPHPDLFLTRPQLIVDVIQQPYTGGLLHTGTVLDGIADAIGNLIMAGVSVFTGWIAPGLPQAITDLIARKEIPSVIFTEESSGIKNASLTVTHPTAFAVVIGGKSPTWVNKLIDLAVEMAITWIFALLSLAVLPGLGAFIAGFFHDVFLAFQKFTDWVLRNDLGQWGFPEAFTNAGAAYTFSGFQQGQKGVFENRGQRMAKVETQDGYPFTAYVDYEVGEMAGWEKRGVLNYDRISVIKRTRTREDGTLMSTIIGDDEPDEAPWEKGMRWIGSVLQIANFNAVNG